jgi:uncharacterized protein (DUF2164 family)
MSKQQTFVAAAVGLFYFARGGREAFAALAEQLAKIDLAKLDQA